MSNIRAIFEGNIKPFTSRINPNTNIMELNKLFLSQVLLAVNKLFPKEQNIKRITITDEEVLEPYRVEDIHASRQTDFEKAVEKNRLDLENYMTLKKPKEMDFSDRASDGKITAMDSLIAEKMTQRNIEIKEFQNSNYNTTDIDPEQWLSSKETSVKVEKNGFQTNNSNNNNVKLKYITPDGNILDQKVDKKVSWQDETNINNIFQKLKRVEEPTNVLDIDDKKQYAQQDSTPLPNVKQEEPVIRNTIINSNIPIIPTSEIVKQMNEMNAKIDNLFEMISKLTNNNL
jgi:hypothetical protein